MQFPFFLNCSPRWIIKFLPINFVRSQGFRYIKVWYNAQEGILLLLKLIKNDLFY